MAHFAFDAARFQADFGRAPFRVGHDLAGHPLLSLPRLVELARRLPENHVEYNAGDVPVSLDPAKTPRTGLSVEETLTRIETARSWLVLKRISQDPEYDLLLDELVAELAATPHPFTEGVFGREGFIFVSSPGSVTPYHMDPELNFLLQIRGTKQMNVFDVDDRDVLSDEELERYLAGAHRNLTFHEEYQRRAHVFELRPGDGLHVPVTAPHWVKNGPAVSISLSITFHSRRTDRRASVYHLNHWLRRRGQRPTPYGRVPPLDSAKFFTMRAVRRARATLGLPPL